MIPTPFETSGAWTDHDAEGAFLEALATDSGRVTVSTIGTTVQGRPIRCATIGYPGPPPAAPTGTALIVSMQHAHEPATREAALQVIRDLAYSTDPDTIAYLTTHPVMVLPAMNPDSHPHTRNNANAVDINRDHLRLLSPEARALSGVLTAAKPQVLIDMHEVMTPGLGGVGDVYVSGANQPQSHPAIRALGEELGIDVRAHVANNGYTGRRYGGGSNPGPLRNHAALRGMLSVITETDGYNHTPAHRAAVAALAVHRVLWFHREHAARITSTLAAAVADKAAEGADPYGVFVLDPGLTIPNPQGYLLTAAQHAAFVDELALLGINATSREGGWFVPMAQQAQPLIPFALDPASLYVSLEAERVTWRSAPVGDAIEWGPILVGGIKCEVVSVELVSPAGLHPVWAQSST